MILTSSFTRFFLNHFISLILFIVLFISTLSIHGQGVKSISRQVFLQLDERQQVELIRSDVPLLIEDLVTPDWQSQLLEPGDRIFISGEDFGFLPLEKRLHILRNEQSYVVVPKSSDLPVLETGGIDIRNMSESELEAYKKNKK